MEKNKSETRRGKNGQQWRLTCLEQQAEIYMWALDLRHTFPRFACQKNATEVVGICGDCCVPRKINTVKDTGKQVRNLSWFSPVVVSSFGFFEVTAYPKQYHFWRIILFMQFDALTQNRCSENKRVNGFYGGGHKDITNRCIWNISRTHGFLAW